MNWNPIREQAEREPVMTSGSVVLVYAPGSSDADGNCYFVCEYVHDEYGYGGDSPSDGFRISGDSRSRWLYYPDATHWARLEKP